MTTATILVVEDNPITRKMLRVALQSDGYTVLEATDGRTAVEVMTRHSPDLVLQDLLLPDLDGFELVKQLRGLPGAAGMPILALSGFLSQVEHARSLQAGFTDHLFKPVEPSHLLRTVRAYLRPTGKVTGRPGAGRRLLLADDDPIQMKLLKTQLEQLGFQVETAQDGAEALAKAQASVPDEVISDVLMPRLDGFRLCQAIRQDARLAHVPVVLTSAVYTEDSDHQLGCAVGASYFLLRTPDNQAVIEALLACLHTAPAPTDGRSTNLPLDEYTHRVIRQLEHHVGLSAQLTRRLALLEAELGILGRVVETLKQSTDVETVLEEMLYRCLDAAGISRGATYLLEPDGRLVLRARLGYPDSVAASLTEFFGHADLLHEVLRHGEPREVSAPKGLDAPTEDLLARAGARSILLTPLILGEQRVGVLEMATESRDLGEDWISFAKAVGSQLGQAIELARTLSRLRVSEQRYRDLVEGLDAIVWEADPRAGRFTFVSRRAESILGYPVARWLAEPDFRARIVHPEDRERALALWPAVLAEGKDRVLDYRAVAADGRVLWLHETVSTIVEAAGRRRQLRGLMVDITERKRASEHESKLRLAREIQQGLFPAAPPQHAGFDIGGASYPAEETGGDYFDFFPLADGALGIAIGDVSGHGIGPALLLAETRAYLRALALTGSDVGATAALLNQALARDMGHDQFVTLLFARLDPRTRSFLYTSAGHAKGYLLGPTGEVKAVLPSTGLPLGIDAGAVFPASGPITLEPGDLLLLPTDGIMEAGSPDGSSFDDDRACDIVRVYRGDSARGIVDNLYYAVRAFSQYQPQVDDITAVVIKVLADA